MKEDNEIVSELETIEKLLIVLLAKLGATSDELGQALGVDASTFRKKVSFSKVKAK